MRDLPVDAAPDAVQHAVDELHRLLRAEPSGQFERFIPAVDAVKRAIDVDDIF